MGEDDRFIDTSPMPEEAPVMWTTLPATFSLKMEFMIERKNLKVQYGGKKRQRKKKVVIEATMFRNLWIRSMTDQKYYLIMKKDVVEQKWKFGVLGYKQRKQARKGISVTSRKKVCR